MDQPVSQPAIAVKRSKYGWCDVRLDTTNAPVRMGHAKIGNIDISCRFLFTKSKWGVLGTCNSPAGVIYLDLDFQEPADCRLESATITLTVSDGQVKKGRPRSSFECPIRFTPYWGPQRLVGTPTRVEEKRNFRCVSEVQVLGHGAGGLGVDSERKVHTNSRWKLVSHLTSKTAGLWDDTLVWELKDNPLDRQPSYSNIFKTAFVLEHDAKAFYMAVTIKGKLSKASDRIKRRLKFGSNKDKHDIVAKIQWEGPYPRFIKLDKLARELPEAMENENLETIPLEIPTARPAPFESAGGKSEHLHPSGRQGPDVLTSSAGHTTYSPLSLNHQPRQPSCCIHDWLVTEKSTLNEQSLTDLEKLALSGQVTPNGRLYQIIARESEAKAAKSPRALNPIRPGWDEEETHPVDGRVSEKHEKIHGSERIGRIEWLTACLIGWVVWLCSILARFPSLLWNRLKAFHDVGGRKSSSSSKGSTSSKRAGEAIRPRVEVPQMRSQADGKSWENSNDDDDTDKTCAATASVFTPRTTTANLWDSNLYRKRASSCK